MHQGNYAVVMGDLNLVRCFIINPVPYVPVATTNNTLVLYSRKALPGIQVADPSRDPERTVRQLIEQAGSEAERPALFYSNDQQLLMLSGHRQELSRYFRFTIPEADTIQSLVNKNLFIEYCQRYELPVPATFRKAQLQELDLARDLPFPCVIKPTTRYLWKIDGVEPDQKAIPVENAEALRRILGQIEEDKDFIVQQYIPGTDDLIISFHAYYDENGACVASYIGQKIRCMPNHNGYSSSVGLVRNPEVDRLGREIMHNTGLTGPVKIDFKYDPEHDRYFLLEINQRFNMWHYLGAVSGINLPYLACQSLYGEHVRVPDDYRTDIKWFNMRRDIQAGLESVRAGRVTVRQWLSSYRGGRIYDKFAWIDPLPAVMGLYFFLRNRITGLWGKLFRK